MEICLHCPLFLNDTRKGFEEQIIYASGDEAVALLKDDYYIFKAVFSSLISGKVFERILQRTFKNPPSHSDLSLLDELEYMLLTITLYPP